MRVTHLWVLLTVAGAFVGPASSPVGLPDIFWTLQRGAWMIMQRAFLDSDPFTSAPHVPGPMVNIQWLADLVYAALQRLGGLELVIAGNALAVAAAYGLALAAAYAVSGKLRLSCVAVWGAYVLGFSNLSPRPQTLAYPLFAFFVWAIARGGTRVLWLLPPATVLWANIHGSFFAGWLLLGCVALGELIQRRSPKPYLLALGGCVLASLLTPYGPGGLVYVATIGSNPIIRNLVTEWAPATVGWREGAFLFAWLGAFAWLALRSRARLTPSEVLILLVFGGLALSSVRAIVWFGLVSAPIAARLLGGLFTGSIATGRERPALNLAIALLTLGITALGMPWAKNLVPFLPDDKRVLISDAAPLRAATYLRSHDPPPRGRMLNHETWGGYLDWAAWPRHQPFVDGRIELHPAQVWLDYLAITFPSPRWRTLLDQYEISYALLSQSDQPDLIADPRQEPGWRLEYEDEQAAVFVRTGS
jgi:hypothetical protein